MIVRRFSPARLASPSSTLNSVAVMMFILFMLLVAIVYINLLVAMMTSSYTTVGHSVVLFALSYCTRYSSTDDNAGSSPRPPLPTHVVQWYSQCTRVPRQTRGATCEGFPYSPEGVCWRVRGRRLLLRSGNSTHVLLDTEKVGGPFVLSRGYIFIPHPTPVVRSLDVPFGRL